MLSGRHVLLRTRVELRHEIVHLLLHVMLKLVYLIWIRGYHLLKCFGYHVHRIEARGGPIAKVLRVHRRGRLHGCTGFLGGKVKCSSLGSMNCNNVTRTSFRGQASMQCFSWYRTHVSLRQL